MSKKSSRNSESGDLVQDKEPSLADFERASRCLGISAFDLWLAYEATQNAKRQVQGDGEEAAQGDGG